MNQEPKMLSVNGGDEMTINNFIDDYGIKDRYDLQKIRDLKVGQETWINDLEITRTK